MRKTFRYRLYPTTAQAAGMAGTLETCRRFYNDCLGERKAAYETEGKTVGKVEQLRRVKAHKKNNPRAAGIHSHVLQGVVADLQKAFDAFFRRVKAGERPGYPRFKPAPRFRSFGYKEYGNGFRVDGRRLKLSGIGRIAVRWHRPLEGVVKTARVVRKAGKWYAAFSCVVWPLPLVPPVAEVGIDAGLNSLFVLSGGEKVENPRWYRHSQRRLRVLQRSVARKKRGGSNRRKAVAALSRFAEKVANRRKDFLDKLACTLVRDNARIAVEDLQVKAMVRGRLSKSILDAGWGYFRQRLCVKAESAGHTVVAVDPAYTSQDCCLCGRRQKLSLSQRWYSCPCGNSRCRDENAALNVLARGQRVWGTSPATAGLPQEAAVL